MAVVGCCALDLIGWGMFMPQVAAANCLDTEPDYIPVETVRQALGLRHETRAQYLDRRYGSGAWHAADTERVRFDSADRRIRIHIAREEASDLYIDLIVESRIEYIDTNDRRTQLTGHRQIGRYHVAAGEAAELTVPVNVFREPGSLLAAVGTPGMRGARRYTVHALDIASTDCARRVYVEDRFTAIRLNRPKDR